MVGEPGWLGAAPANLIKFRNDNNWKSVARENNISATLLKRDGTLWRLGTNRFDGRKPWPGLPSFEPQMLGSDSDWADIVSNGNHTYFRKINGQLWRFASNLNSVKGLIRLDEDTWFYRVTDLELVEAHGDKWVSFGTKTFPNSCAVGVRQDGTFRVTGVWQQRKHKVPLTMAEQNIKIAKETNWIAVASASEAVVTLKIDGSLWKWTFSGYPNINPDAFTCVRLGTQSDWIAINSVADEIVSLAADGGLWSWRFEPMGWNVSGYGSPLVRISRKPRMLANIFDESK